MDLRRAIQKTVPGFPRPLLNLSAESFATVINNAFEKPLHPPFDPYANSINYLLASYVIPYVGLTGYVGANPKLQSPISRRVINICSCRRSINQNILKFLTFFVFLVVSLLLNIISSLPGFWESNQAKMLY